MTLSRALAALLLTAAAQTLPHAAAQTTQTAVPNVPTTLPPVGTPATPVQPPTPPAAPLSSRLYAGASYAPSLSSGGTAYGIVVGSSQVFGPFGAQVAVDFVTASGAISVDTLLLYRPVLRGKLQPYLGAGLGLTSSAAAGSGTVTNPDGTASAAVKTATDYAAQIALGSDYLLTDSIAAYAEASYRSPFSAKGSANGAGLRGRLGIKFLF